MRLTDTKKTVTSTIRQKSLTYLLNLVTDTKKTETDTKKTGTSTKKHKKRLGRKM